MSGSVPKNWGPWLRSTLALAAAVYLIDLALGVRLAYIGVSNDELTMLVLRLFWPLILLIQLKIIVVLLLLIVALRVWAEWGLGLAARPARLAILAIWLAVFLRHARTWPSPYADLGEIRPIPEAWMISLLDGGAGLLLQLAAWLLVLMLTWTAGRAMEGSPRGWFRRAGALALAGALFWTLGRPPALPAWERQPSKDPKRPDVLLLLADSWRADHFECRADSKLTPRLGALCERGGQYLTAYPAQPRTFGSIASLFTGVPPRENGVQHMMVRREHRDLAQRSLVRSFRSLGYGTVAVSGFAGDVFPRITLGFEENYALPFGLDSVIADFCYRWHPLLLPFLATNSLGRAIEPRFQSFSDLADPTVEATVAFEAAAGADSRPLFLTLFLSGTHTPYAGRSGTSWRRGDDPFRARYRWYPVPGESEARFGGLEAAIQHRYADAVQHVDQVLGSLAEQALSRGNTLVVVTSDHGDNLYEFGEGSHGDHLFGNQSLEVPLLLLDSRKGVAPADAAAHLEPSPDQGADATLVALHDALPAVLQAVRGRSQISVPRLNRVMVESGIMIKVLNPSLVEGYRLPYPDYLDLVEVDPESGDFVVRKEWEQTVERGKFRALVTPKRKFLYSPGCKEPRMMLFPRLATGSDALPGRSLHETDPEAIEVAWTLMQEHWGSELVRRSCDREPSPPASASPPPP